MRGLKRQTGGADGRSNAVGCRRNAEGAEMRGLKRQTGVLTDEATRLAGEETRRQRKDAAPGLAAVGTQQFRADNSPHLRLFYL